MTKIVPAEPGYSLHVLYPRFGGGLIYGLRGGIVAWQIYSDGPPLPIVDALGLPPLTR